MLLFLLFGLLLFRFAERTFSAELFQFPPRFTRLDPEDAPSQYSITEISGTRKQQVRRYRFRTASRFKIGKNAISSFVFDLGYAGLVPPFCFLL